MARREVISCCLLLWSFEIVFSEPVVNSYGPPPQEETEVEIQKVEVYEVPWIGDQEQKNGYGLSSQQYGPAPSAEYGPPSPEYGAPAQEYGPPNEYTTTDYPSITTTEALINSTDIEANSTNAPQNQTERLQTYKKDKSQGHYYIYHPTGQLQKVTYLTKDDNKNMAFTAQLKYKNVDPVRGPIYTYDPNTYVFSRLNRK